MSRKLENLRNIGIIAHIDAGKTTLTERMLFYAGATHRMGGNVDQGTTETDFDEEEQQRGITIYSAAVSFDWHDCHVNLIDTPGHVDFTAEVERSLRVLDGGVVVFSAREGVEAQSETVWRQADRNNVPRIAFINKMDREGADFFRTLDEIHERLGAAAIPLQIPVGAGPEHVKDPFRFVIDLVSMKMLAFTTQKSDAKVVESEIPEEAARYPLDVGSEMPQSLDTFVTVLCPHRLDDDPPEVTTLDVAAHRGARIETPDGMYMIIADADGTGIDLEGVAAAAELVIQLPDTGDGPRIYQVGVEDPAQDDITWISA